MTLISLACTADRAQIMTDTSAYTENVSRLGRTSKALPIPHLDAAIVTQGDHLFMSLSKVNALEVAEHVTTFDELAGDAPDWLRNAYASCETRTESAVWLAGWSSELERFAAYCYTTERDWQAERVEGLSVYPAPYTMRPSTMETPRVREWFVLDFGDPERADQMMTTWQGKPAGTPPQDTAEWVALARLVREHRGLEQVGRVIVSGQVYLTTLTRGRATTELIHEYDDYGEEFRRLIAGTAHPQAQLGPCPCGSGARFLDCCMTPHLDHPCTCGSQQTFRDCCMVPTPEGVS